MAEYLAYCYQDQVDPHDIYGSYAGAFGYGQFIPSSFNSYAVDFDGDGVRQPFDWPDVFGSVANYLIRNGYPKMSNDFTTSGKVGAFDLGLQSFGKLCARRPGITTGVEKNDRKIVIHVQPSGW